MGWKIDKSAAA